MLVAQESKTQWPGISELAGQYLSFEVGEMVCALQKHKVKGLGEAPEILTFPESPRFVKGIVNVRGNAIPLIDLHGRFGMRLKAESEGRDIILVWIHKGSLTLTAAVLTDAIRGIVDVQTDQIEPAPADTPRMDTSMIPGMATVRGTERMLLDLDGIFSEDEVIALKNIENDKPTKGPPVKGSSPDNRSFSAISNFDAASEPTTEKTRR